MDCILTDFITGLSETRKRIKRLAFSYNDSTLRCWAVIPDGDEKLEDDIIMAKARVDANYAGNGLYLFLMVLEESDPVTPPKQYQTLQTDVDGEAQLRAFAKKLASVSGASARHFASKKLG